MAAEVTHTAENIYGLRKGVGRGGRLWAGKITIATGSADYLTTGLDTIHSIGFQQEELAAVDAATGAVTVKTLAAGKITFATGDIDAYGAMAVTGWCIVIGSANGYHA